MRNYRIMQARPLVLRVIIFKIAAGIVTAIGKKSTGHADEKVSYLKRANLSQKLNDSPGREGRIFALGKTQKARMSGI